VSFRLVKYKIVDLTFWKSSLLVNLVLMKVMPNKWLDMLVRIFEIPFGIGSTTYCSAIKNSSSLSLLAQPT